MQTVGPLLTAIVRQGSGRWLLPLAVALVAISDQSLWIDEAWSAVKAQAPTLCAWWEAMVAEKLSDLQMPLYMVYLWAFEKLFGDGEWTLRMANWPWFAVGMAAVLNAFPARDPRRTALGWVICLSPFAWYCLNEARPYAMQLGAGLLVLAGLLRQAKGNTLNQAQHGVALFCAGVALLAGSSLLGAIWAASAVAVAALHGPKGVGAWLITRRWVAVLTGVWLCGLAGYYLWTLKVGARASPVAGTDWKNLGFIGYELLGLSGLGPGRLALRETGLDALRPYGVAVALYGAVTGVALGTGIWTAWQKNRRVLLPAAGILAGTGLFLLGSGWAWHFRVLGRHFAPAAVVILLLLSVGLAELWQQRTKLGRLVVLSFCALSLGSCLSLRFAARHEKDDYRGAAVVAKRALQAGQVVWWNADRAGAAYYGVPTSVEGQVSGKALWLMNPSLEFLRTAAAPDLVLTSKPDLYDGRGAVAEYLAQAGFQETQRRPAFSVWQRPESEPPPDRQSTAKRKRLD